MTAVWHTPSWNSSVHKGERAGKTCWTAYRELLRHSRCYCHFRIPSHRRNSRWNSQYIPKRRTQCHANREWCEFSRTRQWSRFIHDSERGERIFPMAPNILGTNWSILCKATSGWKYCRHDSSGVTWSFAGIQPCSRWEAHHYYSRKNDRLLSIPLGELGHLHNGIVFTRNGTKKRRMYLLRKRSELTPKEIEPHRV